MPQPPIEIEFNSAWRRVCALTGWSNYGQMADYLGIKPPSVSGAKQRGLFPSDWIIRIALGYKVPFEELAFSKPRFVAGDTLSNVSANIGWDAQLMTDIIEAVEEVLEEMREKLIPAEKAKVITKMYEIYLDEGAKPQKQEIRRQLRLVV